MRSILAWTTTAAALTAATIGLGVAATPAASAAPAAITRYAPFVYLAPGENYQPTDAGHFVAQSSLSWSRDQSCRDDTLAARTTIDANRLGHGGYQHQISNGLCIRHGAQHRSDQLTRPRQQNKPGVPDGEGFFLNLPNTLRHGEGTNAPVYYDYRAHQSVTYWFFYAFNDAPRATNMFDHEGDWERISVRLDNHDQATAVAYYEHEGYCTLPWRNAGKHDQRPLAYSARGTHATYPQAGTFPIAHGFATDTTGRGDAWDQRRHLVDVRTQPWYGFGGAWGEVGEGSDSTGPLGPSPFKPPAPTDWSRPCR